MPNTAYVRRLQELRARISMAEVGTPYQNASAESFMKTLKAEEVWVNEDRTRFSLAERGDEVLRRYHWHQKK